MKKTIEETTRLLLNGTLSKEDADKILLNICGVSSNEATPNLKIKESGEVAVCDHPQTARTYWQGEIFCVRCKTTIKQ